MNALLQLLEYIASMTYAAQGERPMNKKRGFQQGLRDHMHTVVEGIVLFDTFMKVDNTLL